MSLSRCREPLTTPFLPLLGFLWPEQAPAGATVPPRSRRVCPKVRCVTSSWSPCNVERRIWVSADLALLASILATRMCLPNWAWSHPFPAHKHSLAPIHRTPTTTLLSRPQDLPEPVLPTQAPHPLCSNCFAVPSVLAAPDLSLLPRTCYSLCCENP